MIQQFRPPVAVSSFRRVAQPSECSSVPIELAVLVRKHWRCVARRQAMGTRAKPSGVVYLCYRRLSARTVEPRSPNAQCACNRDACSCARRVRYHETLCRPHVSSERGRAYKIRPHTRNTQKTQTHTCTRLRRMNEPPDANDESPAGPSFARRVKRKRKLTIACDFCRKRSVFVVGCWVWCVLLSLSLHPA